MLLGLRLVPQEAVLDRDAFLKKQVTSLERRHVVVDDVAGASFYLCLSIPVGLFRAPPLDPPASSEHLATLASSRFKPRPLGHATGINNKHENPKNRNMTNVKGQQ